MLLRNLLSPEQRERLDRGVCYMCGNAFTSDNVHSEAGWRETKLSGSCEDCFDELFREEDE